MQYISIVPPQYEGRFPRRSYRMALAQWALEYPLYVEAVKEGAGFIILDNGAFEHEQPTSGLLLEAIEKVDPHEFILPDVQGDPEVTIEQSWMFLVDDLSTPTRSRRLNSVMFVPTGHTVNEWILCLERWTSLWTTYCMEDEYGLTIGIAALRHTGTTDPIVGSRVELLDQAMRRGHRTHLLGINNPQEFHDREIEACRLAGTRSVDSSLAFALGAHNYVLTETSPKIPLGDPKQYEVITKGGEVLIRRSMATLHYWVARGTQ